MRSHLAYGTILLAFLQLQVAVAWMGERKPPAGSNVEATLSIMADRLIPEEDLVAAVNHVLEVGEYIEVLSIEEDVSSSVTAKGQGRKAPTRKGRGLLYAPAPADNPDLSGILQADQQGTGLKPDSTAAPERLFTTAAFQRGDSILSRVGFGLQRPAQQPQSPDNNNGVTRSTLQSSASSLQPESVEIVPGSTRLWDASVAEAQRRGSPTAGLYPDGGAAQGPTAGRPTVQTDFGLQRKPIRSSTGGQPFTDDALFANAPTAAVPIRTLWHGPSGAHTGHSLITQMVGVGLEKPPAERAAGLADSALALVPAAAAPGSKPVAAMSAEAATAGGGIESLRTVHFQQQAQSSATVDNAANGAAGAPPLSARRRGLAAWGDNVAEVKDETWVREGWHGGAKSGAAKAGTARRGTGGLGRRAKVGLGTGRGRLEPLTADAADDDEEVLYMTSAVRGQAKNARRGNDASIRLGSELGESDLDADGDDFAQALRALPRGRSLPLVAQSGAAIKGGSRKAPHRKKRPNKPFQPKNKDYLTDALAAIVEASLDTDKSRRQGLQETKNTAVDIVERVTGYKQVPRDPKDVDRDGSLGDTKASKPAQRQEGKAEASGQGEATALGRQESAGELEGYVSQQAAIRLFSSDPKALERLKSHRVLAKIKQTLRDMGIPAADVAVLPKVQGKENKGWSGGSDAAEKQKLKTKRWLLAAGNVSEEPQKPLPSRLVAAIQAAAGFVHLTLPSEGQAHSIVTTE